jgi:uncharacterized membrane protein
MLWIFAALATAVIYTFVNIFDTHMMQKRIPSMPAYVLPLGICQLIIGVIILAFFPFPQSVDFKHLAVAYGSGLLNAISLMILLIYLQKGEVSRVVPITTSAPIFVALLSIPILSEVLGVWQWLAVFATVAGAILISLQPDPTGKKTKLHSSFFVLLLAALMTAIANIGYKYALDVLSFWNMMTVTGFCVVIVLTAFTLRKSTLTAIKNMQHRNQNLSFIVGNQLIAAVAATLGFVAIQNGPVALATALMNIRPAFVFLFTVAIARFFPGFTNERFTRATILQKMIGIALITGGIVIISLSG